MFLEYILWLFAFKTLIFVGLTREKFSSHENIVFPLPEYTLDYILDKPQIRLYERENFEGDSEVFAFKRSGGCHKTPSFMGKVRSIETYGKCVRLFYQEACVGWSLAVYPGSKDAGNILNSKLKQVTTVGPCMREEFEGAQLMRTISGDRIIKSKTYPEYFPDLSELDSWDLYNNGKILEDSSVTPMKGYLLGVGGRLEYVAAFVNYQHLQHLSYSQYAQSQIENSSYWKEIDKEEGDTIGYAIPLALGGSSNETFNVFPLTPEAAIEWKIRTAFIPQCLREHVGTGLWIAVTLKYSNEFTKRPYLFTYRFDCWSKTFYGIIRQTQNPALEGVSGATASNHLSTFLTYWICFILTLCK